MASATPGGDTVVSSDVPMTDRDQPSTAVLERTASSLKRLHNGEVKQAGAAGGGDVDVGADTLQSADQLPDVLKAGAKAAASLDDKLAGNDGAGDSGQQQVIFADVHSSRAPGSCATHSRVTAPSLDCEISGHIAGNNLRLPTRAAMRLQRRSC